VNERRELWIVDRFEGGLAVVERALHETLTLPRALLPAGTREGDVLRVVAQAGDGESRFTVTRDPEETRRRAAEAGRMLDQMKQQDSGGDVKL
jgi:hypothetical protein